nr:zinc finger, CCHC-type [Tanacetum cinerariifolium]
RMQIILEANGLWEMIEPNEKTEADNKRYKTAIAFLYQALPEEKLLQITKYKTAKAIWEALKTRHLREERVQQARLQTLKSDFEMLQMKEDETIDAFTTKLTTLVNKAASLGHTMEDGTLVRKLLNVVPDRITNQEWKEIPFNLNLTDIKQQGVSSESLDVGITESMNQPGIKEDIHWKNSKLEGGNNQKYDQPGLKEDHKLEGGNNQKYDQPGLKEDHNNEALISSSARHSAIVLTFLNALSRAPVTKKDKTAIAFLYQALPEEQLLQITKHKTAKAIWDALKTRHIGEERVQQARLQTLKSDFEMLHMKEDETIDTFTEKLTTLVNKAASLGHTMEDGILVRKLLNAVPDRYLQIIESIEQYSDLSEMTLEEKIGRFKTYEERIKYKKGKQVDNQEKLMFT